MKQIVQSKLTLWKVPRGVLRLMILHSESVLLKNIISNGKSFCEQGTGFFVCKIQQNT